MTEFEQMFKIYVAISAAHLLINLVLVFNRLRYDKQFLEQNNNVRIAQDNEKRMEQLANEWRNESKLLEKQLKLANEEIARLKRFKRIKK